MTIEPANLKSMVVLKQSVSVRLTRYPKVDHQDGTKEYCLASHFIYTGVPDCART